MSNGIPRPPRTIVTPRAPAIRLRTPVSGGSAPEMRRTFQVPSSSATSVGSPPMASANAATPGPNVPFPPMEAELVSELPRQGAWRYEPKWDGFRGVLENDGGELALWSRNGRPLLRYFPELRELGERLPARSALDGEIVIARDGRLDFDALQLRLHPAASLAAKLAAETPASMVCFDLLALRDESLLKAPFADRRAALVALGRRFSGALHLTPATTSRA